MNYEIDLLHEINRDVEPHNLKITYKIEVLEPIGCLYLFVSGHSEIQF